MGFIRQQEENLAMRLLAWQYQRTNIPLPAQRDLRQQAGKFVDDAHRIALERGQNVMSIMKDMAEDLRRK